MTASASEPGKKKQAAVRFLNPASGYLTGYAYTLNPYVGCSFGCSYCYVRRMPIAMFRGEPWGEWVEPKRFEEDAFRKEWRKALAKGNVTVFMSSATDPYQPAEYKEGVTRKLLEIMAEEPPQFLLVQTRSPLVIRDIDLFRTLGDRIRISMTVETDLKSIRKKMTPDAPPLAARLRAIRELREAGIPVQAAVSPLLPCSDKFAGIIAASVERVVVDDFFRGDGSGGKRTAQLKMVERYQELGHEALYTPQTADLFLQQLSELMPHGTVYFGQQGFLP
ncbi:radical SAM protein [Paenibacillus sp. CF384]|uniref:SPL family radical SAM protein n=1 Tax=Paenibacillus sp. CF384 TaxID=1884382 RepID=UPI00089C8E8A|nr:radical SAM protein [Paenibacillus sp. CF384]SDW85640.1 Radical SAM superfamily protein [Paenibacillus sp. CF384]